MGNNKDMIHLHQEIVVSIIRELASGKTLLANWHNFSFTERCWQSLLDHHTLEACRGWVQAIRSSPYMAIGNSR